MNFGRISPEEALRLYHEANLFELGEAANRINRAKNGDVVGYIIDRNINYTNVCVLNCTFCNFYRKKVDADSYTLSFEELDEKIRETIRQGGTGILMQGGHHPDYKIDWYEGLLSYIRDTFPKLHIHAFSPPEINHIANVSKLSFHETLERLKKAGLMSIPGGGGEILVDRVRRKISPGKLAGDWLGVMEAAHEVGLPTSATMMMGHIETVEDRIEHLTKLRDLQDKTGGFFAFIPWTYQSIGTDLGEPQSPASPHEYLKMLALSRIFLDNFKNIQASWLTQGLKVGQIALNFGANDLGSVMIEENVISQAGAKHKAVADDLIGAIQTAGLIPRKRDNCYHYLPSFF